MRRLSWALGVCALAVQCEGTDIFLGNERKQIVDAGEGGLIRACPVCSSDLHSIVDCDGNPKLTCPPELACSPEGTCVSPCEGAAKNQTSLGCDFVVVEPDVLQVNWQGACHALLVANAWAEPVKMEISRNGATLDAAPFMFAPARHSPNPTSYDPIPNGAIPPDGMAVVILGGANQSCGLPSALDQIDLAVHGSGRGRAVRIKTTRPVSIADVYPWTQTPDPQKLPAVPSASLLLPVSAWTNTSFGVTGWNVSQGVDGGVNAFWSALVIASVQDTMLTLSPLVNVQGGPGIMPIPKDTSKDVPLGAGETLQLEQFDDLSGTVVRSSKDVISVWGTHQCMTIPNGNFTCDAAHQQLPPPTAMGSEYVALRYPSRSGGAGEEVVPWRFVGLVDQTALAFDPPIQNAPLTLRFGQTRTFDAAGPFVVKSQDPNHPFFMSAHMTSYGSRGATGSEGDPESVIMVPVEQWLTSYRFAVDPTYRNVQLVVARKRIAGSATPDIVLDCLGALPGWVSIAGGRFDITHVDIVRDGMPFGNCDFGAHHIESESPNPAVFSATLWGTDAAVSYAYPIGAAVRPINGVRFDPIPTPP